MITWVFEHLREEREGGSAVMLCDFGGRAKKPKSKISKNLSSKLLN